MYKCCKGCKAEHEGGNQCNGCDAVNAEEAERITEADAAKKDFMDKWNRAYGRRPETVDWKKAR